VWHHRVRGRDDRVRGGTVDGFADRAAAPHSPAVHV
jgi:hypothetical protein